MHPVEAHTLASQHAEILTPHAFSDAWPALSTPHSLGVNSFKDTDTPTPALMAATTDSESTLDYNGLAFLMQLKGRIPQIQDSHC